MAKPRALILAGEGLNCEAETARAFARAGAETRILPVREATPADLAACQILAIPGGFSYADHTGAGNALAARLRLTLGSALTDPGTDRLTLGICNGCQVLAALGMVGPGREAVTVLPNKGGRYEDRWVHLQIAADSPSPWLQGLGRLHLPVAHGEGQFHLTDAGLAAARAGQQVAARYVCRDGAAADGAFPANPNGSVEDIAGLTDPTGRVLGMMPHPERAQDPHHLPDWHHQRDRWQRGEGDLPTEGPGLALFRNAVRWFD